MADRVDVAIVGGGIVGLATAHLLLEARPRLRVAVLEKEAELATHQSGHNSGVIHAGIYYAPGSLKATLCREGKAKLERFAGDHGIAFRHPGKLVVALRDDEGPRLEALCEGVQLEPFEPGRARYLGVAAALLRGEAFQRRYFYSPGAAARLRSWLARESFDVIVAGQSGQCRVLPPLPTSRTEPDPSDRTSRSPTARAAASLARAPVL